MEGGLRRRTVLGGIAASVPMALAGCLRRNDPAPGAGHPALTPPREEAFVAMLDVPGEPAAARSALTALAGRVRALNRGDDARAMVGMGGSWFTKAGLAGRRPPGATAMPGFAGDLLEPRRTGSDLLLQVEARSAGTAADAAGSLTAGLAGIAPRWQVAGQRPGNELRDGRPLSLNGFGFTEGFGNHDLRDGAAVDDVTLIRPGADVPGWAVGGTYLAVRVIRLSSDLWDPEPRYLQERIIGRRTDGTWLDGTPPADEPAFDEDPHGRTTPLDSHVRRANPRTPGSEPGLIRRSWNYRDGVTPGGTPDEGVLFMCYQADLDAGFTAVQRRLAGQSLDAYILTVGGGFYVVPPPDGADAHWEDALR
jgi:deferrochelatase/peroxidase EfeB